MPAGGVVRKLKLKLGVRNDLIRCLLAEFLGTFVLVLIADGGGASVITSGLNPLENNLWLSCTVGLAVGFGIWTGYGVSGGHVNPSVTIGLASTGKFPWRRVPLYFLTQFLGAFTGAGICYLVYYDAINNFDGGSRQAVNHPNATCGIFTTFPAPYLTLTAGFLEQVLNTGIMLGLVHVIGDTQNAGPSSNLAPFFYGIIVTAVALSYGVNAGAPLNPARDLAGRVLCAAAGYGKKVWIPYNDHWWWIPTFGPLVGACVGSLIYFFGIELHHPLEKSDIKETEADHAANESHINPGFVENTEVTEEHNGL